jgi:hypothetical protein
MFCLAVMACDSEPPAPPQQADIDRLLALPYAGSKVIDKGDEESGVLQLRQGRSYPGFTLYTVQELALAQLIDQSGGVIKSWSDSESAHWEKSELLPNGDLLVIGADRPAEPVEGIPDESRYLARFDWNGGLLWKRHWTFHHDIEPTASGQLLALTFARRQIPELIPELEVRDDLLTLLSPEGEPVHSRSVIHAFRGRPDIHEPRTPRPTAEGVRPWVDVFHANSLQGMPYPHLEGRHPIYAPSNVLISSRHQNIIAVIDWRTGKAIWAWGAGELLAPNDAQFLGNGNIMVFDNGLGRGWSRVIELDPVTATIVWEYEAPDPEDFYSISRGSCQRLPNGNTLIADSDNARAFEVTPDGDLVWEFVSPHETSPGRRATIVRAQRYDRDFIERIVIAAGS